MRPFLLPSFALVRLCLYYGGYVRATNTLISNPALCKAIIGLIAAKMNYPLLYVFFIVSACCTCSCYSLNSVYDLMVLTGYVGFEPHSYMKPLLGMLRIYSLPQSPFLASREPETDLTGETTNCSNPEHQYHYQKIDLGLETFGIILHMIAIFLALKYDFFC